MLHNRTIFFNFLKITILLVSVILISGQNQTLANSFKSLPRQIQGHLLANNPYVRSDVSDNPPKQELDFLAVGLHRRSCTEAMKVIGQYENYHRYISFVKRSTYSKNRINLELSSTFMPFDMVLNFKLPRISGPGVYPFVFDNGFLHGLKGRVHVVEFRQNKKFNCYIAMQAYWKGRKTKIPSYIFGMFTKTVGEIGMSKLFRMSGHRY